MNKKIATLGLAAVLGLAGVVALPAIAAELGMKKSTYTYERTAGSTDEKGSVFAIETVMYDGTVKINADQTAGDAAKLKQFFIGSELDETNAVKFFYSSAADDDTKAGTEVDPVKTEEKAQELAKAKAKKAAVAKNMMLEVSKGTFDNAALYLEGLYTAINGWKDEEKAKISDFSVIIKATDDKVTYTGLEKIAKFVELTKGKVEVKYENSVKVLNMSTFNNIFPIQLENGKFSINKSFEKIKLSDKLYISEAKKIAGLGAGVILNTAGNDVLDANGFNTPKADQNQNQDNKTEDKAGDKNKKPEGGIKTPDTGIAE